MTGATVFVCMFALDFLFARYTMHVTTRNAAGASIYAAACIAMSGMAAIGYTSEPWLLMPAMAGAFAGTFISIKLGS